MRNINSKIKTSTGFTILEVLVVISVIVILVGLSISYFRPTAKRAEIDGVAKRLIFDLKSAREKAQAGENVNKWGIHAVNGADDYYEIFETPTIYSNGSTVVFSTVYLPIGLTFETPTEGNSTDIIFNKISGTTTPATISLVSESSTVTITVTSIGTVY